MVHNVKPITLAKISDLTANLRPVDSGILNKECHSQKYPTFKDLNKGVHFNVVIDLSKVNQKLFDETNQLSGVSNKNDSQLYDFLMKNCRAFDQKALVEPIFSRISGVWRVCYILSIK